MMSPLFSIITVTYNAERTLERTLESVASQEFKDFEHLIVDGASSDRTIEIAESFKSAIPGLIMHSEKDRGLYDAMNKGIGLSRGKYLIFLNAGDKFHDSYTLSIIAQSITSGNDPAIVYGQTDIVDDTGVYLGPRHLTAPPDLKLKDFARGMLVCHQAFIVLKRIAPLYNLQYKYSADYEWCIRCLQHARNVEFIDKPLIDYLSEGVTTANHKKSLIERFKIMCYYYGTIPTLIRHVGFAIRNYRRKNASL